MLKSKPVYIVIVAVVIMIALGMGATWAYFSDVEGSTSNVVRTINNWYDLAWHWRKPITINNGGGALTNFQIALTVDTQTLIGASKMQANGQDIRFTTSGGVTLIDYWIQSGINTATTIIWVEVPSVPAGNSTIYMYYGNASAPAASNGDNTFLFFDDFEVDLSKWTIINPTRGSATRVTSPVANGSYSMYLDENSNGASFGASAAFTAQTQCVIEYYARPVQTNAIWETDVNSGGTNGPYLRFNSDASVEYNDTAWKDFSPVVSYAANTWYSYKLDNVNASTGTYSVYIDGSLKGSNIAFNNAVASVNQIRFTAEKNTLPKIYVDLVKVRKYASPEPVMSGIGAEE